ncbi:MAG TPA: PQQ-binding-like beta-propeller repeat protein [Thermomonospora sp.]|nr:PQQ-binding-like beta-propeller repeat protein [Thermomonospora sp.]
MTVTRKRRVLGLVAGALAVATAAALLDRLVLDAEWWQVDHRIASAAATPLPDIGPSPGPLMATWDRTTGVHRGDLPGYDRVAHGLVHGQTVAVSGRGLDVRDARTGAERWSYRRSGWTVLGWTVTGGHLVAYLERNGHRDDRVMVGFDARTGRVLWRGQGHRPAALARATLRWPAGSGVVLAAASGGHTLYGLSTATGQRLWTLRLRAGCAVSQSAAHASGADERLAALTLECGGRSRYRLMALDPAAGRILWEKTTESSGPRQIVVRGSVTVASDDTSLHAYTADGRRLLTRGGEDVCGGDACPAAMSGDRLVIAWERGRRAEAVHVPSGRVLWRRNAPGYLALTTAGGRFYGLRAKVAGTMLPAGVDVLDPADGTPTTAAAELAIDAGLDGARPWMAAAGGLLYVAAPQESPRPGGGARLTALRGGPVGPGTPELGGVAAADWPDACGLLRRSDLESARLTGYDPAPVRVTVGDVRLPRPASCEYRPGRSARDEVDAVRRDTGEPEPAEATGDPRGLTVSVKWVAPDAGAAADLLAAMCDVHSQVRHRDDLGGDEAYELGPTAGSIAVRVDRYIIGVYAAQPAATAARLARTAATNLRVRLP